MNEFERKIREAMAVTRNNANPRLPVRHGGQNHGGNRRAVLRRAGAGGQAAAGKRRRGGAPNIRRMKRKPPPRKAPSPRLAIARPMRRRPRAGCLAAPR